jgi:hypothetical protein
MKKFPEGNYTCKVIAIVILKQHNPSLEETSVILESAKGQT